MRESEWIYAKAGSGGLAEAVDALGEWLENSDRVLVGAGAGLSAAAGLSYLDEDLFRRFQPEMAARGYHYPYQLFEREKEGWPEAREWAYLVRHIHFVRHVFPPAELYRKLLALLAGRDFFVVTSNCDRQLLRTGFPMERVFEAQGSYDRLRCTAGCTRETWAVEPVIDRLLPLIDPETFTISDESAIPRCPSCGASLATAFRSFDGYREERGRYEEWIEGTAGGRLCILELGVGFNTPGVIRWPFERLAHLHGRAHLFRVNREYREWPGHGGFAMVPAELAGRATPMPWDAGEVIERLHVRFAKAEGAPAGAPAGVAAGEGA
ncbi:MAG: NAD-dependent protein deacetylase of SIR2 family [Acidobacteria bacterium]|nr:NAD-dependent protein deacetylase of SIR2 family [Acidobacteriota bacterium]